MNILFFACSNDALAAGLTHRGHCLELCFSLDDFARHSALFADADVILADEVAVGSGVVGVWRALGDARPPMVVLGEDGLPDLDELGLFALPRSAGPEIVEASLRLLVDSQNSRRRIDALHAQLEHDRHLMRQTIERFIPRSSLEDSALRWWVHGTDDLEGELLLAARAPNGVLNVMAIQGSLVALPLIAPFHRMTEKGFGIDAILTEMDTRLLRLHPGGLAVAASLLSINFKTGAAQVWHSGGTALLKASRRNRPLLARQSAPLGVPGAFRFQPELEVWGVHEGDRLILCSSGLMTALNAGPGQSDLVERLDSLIASASNGRNPLEALPGADKMLVVVDCSSAHGGTSSTERPCPPSTKRILPPGVAGSARWKLTLTIGPEEMRQVDVVPLLLGVVGQFQAIGPRTGNLFLVLAELYNNALDHGVLRLDSTLKSGPDGMATFLEERAKRLAMLTSGSIDITLALENHDGSVGLLIVCRDSGEGFDHQRVRQEQAGAEASFQPFGRGLALVGAEVSLLAFNDAGNEVKVWLSLDVNGTV